MINEDVKRVRWLESKTIAFVGDSVTADKRHSYVSMVVDRLADLIDVSTINVINDGIDSSSICDALDRLPALLEQDPDVIVICLGINDSKIFWHVDKPLLYPEVFETIYKTFLERADFPRIRKKVLVTPLNLLFDDIRNGDFLTDYWYWEKQLYYKYIEAIRRLADGTMSSLADANVILADKENIQKYLCTDGVHPNVYGHRVIAEAVLHALITLGK